MADPNSPDDLFPFAENLVAQLVRRHGLEWDDHRKEDAAQDLFLAGWQVWSDEQDIGLAKNRMVSRTKNLLRDFSSEQRHEPRAESDQLTPKPVGDDGQLWDEGAVRGWTTPPKRDELRGDPEAEASVQEYLDRLPDRRRQIVMLRMAGYAHQEIADELGIGLRTVERELSQLRKEQEHDANR